MPYTALQKATASRYARRWKMTDVSMFYKRLVSRTNKAVQVLFVSMYDADDIEYHVEFIRKVANMTNAPTNREVVDFKKKFIVDAMKIHGDKYTYDNVVNDSRDKLKKLSVTCPKHGDFLVTKSNHINCFTGCPKCAEDKFKRREKDSFLNEKSKTNEE